MILRISPSRRSNLSKKKRLMIDAVRILGYARVRGGIRLGEYVTERVFGKHHEAIFNCNPSRASVGTAVNILSAAWQCERRQQSPVTYVLHCLLISKRQYELLGTGRKTTSSCLVSENVDGMSQSSVERPSDASLQFQPLLQVA